MNVWFTSAHFESRNELEISGEGKNIEAINNCISKLEINEVAYLQKGRSGEEKREIKSAAGKTTFEIEIEIKEVSKKNIKSDDGNNTASSLK